MYASKKGLKPRLISVKQFAQEHFTRKSYLGPLDLKSCAFSVSLTDLPGEHAFTVQSPLRPLYLASVLKLVRGKQGFLQDYDPGMFPNLLLLCQKTQWKKQPLGIHQIP